MTYKKANAADLRAIAERLYETMNAPTQERLRSLRHEDQVLRQSVNELKDRVRVAEGRYAHMQEQFAAFKKQVLTAIAESENRR